MPNSFEALLLIVLFILPGFIGISVKEYFAPSTKQTQIATILNSILLSCLNYVLTYYSCNKNRDGS